MSRVTVMPPVGGLGDHPLLAVSALGHCAERYPFSVPMLKNWQHTNQKLPRRVVAYLAVELACILVCPPQVGCPSDDHG